MRSPASAIATAGPAAYLRRVSLTRLIRFLTILAVALSPIAMLVGTPAQASSHRTMMMDQATAPMAAGHCADMDDQSTPSKHQPTQSHDCMMACAAIPSLGSEIAAAPIALAAAEPVRLNTLGHGLEPEAATPPPRFA